MAQLLKFPTTDDEMILKLTKHLEDSLHQKARDERLQATYARMRSASYKALSFEAKLTNIFMGPGYEQ